MSDPGQNPFGDPRIDRVSSAEARDGLERLAGSDVLRNGGVNLIGLDAIRRHLGDRWPAKRARIWEHIERELEKRLSPYDMVHRLDDVNYLVAMPTVSRFQAQALCMHVLQDVLQFFLGESQKRDVVVRNVTSVSGDEVSSAPLDPAAIERDHAAPPPEAHEEHEHDADWKPPLAGRTESASFIGQSRTPVEVSLGVEAVWNLRRDLITSFVIERASAPPATDPADLLQVDIAVMAYASQILQEHKTTGGRLTLHLPISYSSVASARSRELSIKMMRHLHAAMRETTLIEIANLDPGVPPSRLIEIVSLIKPFGLGVLARVRPTRKALDAVRGCGLKGLILDAGALGRNRAETVTLMKAFADAAHGIAPNLIVHGLDDISMVEAARAAGLTHASVRPDLKFDQAVNAA
jgi:hypothetical protein